MITELFQGNPQALKARIDAIILASAPTDLKIIPTSDKSWYLLMWTP